MSEATFYGDLTFCTETHKWKITNLAPHVSMAFKRLFTRVDKMAIDIELTDTDENRADLDWFCLRYPLRHKFTNALAAGARRMAARMAERGRILAPDWTPPAIEGFNPPYEPYLYQTQAATIALAQGALLLADDVGLGKTISSFATSVLGAPLPMAIVVEPHLATQWQKQIKKFIRGGRVHVIQSRTPYDLPPADFYIYKYSNVCGWNTMFKAIKFPSVVFDEIQQLRHGPKTDKGIACLTIAQYASFKIGLSATPTYNYGDEIHTIMRYIQPDLLGTREEFLREWCGGGASVTDPDALGSFLRNSGYFLRRTEDDASVDRSMPKPNVLDVEIACDHKEIENEMELLRMLAQTVLSGKPSDRGQASRTLDMRLRQLTGIGKAKYVAAYVRMLLQDAERVVIAGWHREFWDIVMRHLEPFNPVLFTGSETAKRKDAAVERFTEGDARVLGISLRSGAGLDGLQYNCNDLVVGELDWSPMVHGQLLGRLRRPGQTKQVNGHFLWTDEGSDPPILEVLGAKSEQGRGIVDPGKMIAPREADEGRIKKLAAKLLEREPEHA